MCVLSQHLNIAKSEVGTSTAHFLKRSEIFINRTYAVDDFVAGHLGVQIFIPVVYLSIALYTIIWGGI